MPMINDHLNSGSIVSWRHLLLSVPFCCFVDVKMAVHSEGSCCSSALPEKRRKSLSSSLASQECSSASLCRL